MYRIIKGVFFGFIIGCVSRERAPHIEPFSEDEVKECINKLSNKCFEFIIKLKKPGLKGKFTGIFCIHPTERAKVERILEFDGEKEKAISIGIGEKEYRLEEGKWKVEGRTQETEPISILKLVCSMGKYKFETSRGNYFIYKFPSNLLFLDPTLLDTLIEGTLWINKENQLLHKIKVKTKNISWSFEVTRFFRAQEGHKILSPLAKKRKIEVISDSHIERIAEILKQRFEAYGLEEVNYELKGNSFSFEFLADSFSQELIQELTRPGKLELYEATYPRGSTYTSEEVHFVRGDSTNPVFLGKKIERKLLSVKLNRKIELIFDKELPEEQKIAVVVDKEVMEIIPKVWGNSLKVRGDKLTWIKIKFPLPCEVKTRKL